MVHALRLPPMAVMARALDNPSLNRSARSRCARAPATASSTGRDDPARDAPAAGRRGRRRPDRSAHSRAAMRSTSTSSTVPLRRRLPSRRWRCVPARQCRTAVRAAAWRRSLPDDLRAPGRTAGRQLDEHPLREFTQRCTDVLEMYVRRNPELWLWMHRRWRAGKSSQTGGVTKSTKLRRRGS